MFLDFAIENDSSTDCPELIAVNTPDVVKIWTWEKRRKYHKNAEIYDLMV